ncbi:MAG: hydrogen peroxide-inducible genes activator [Pseudomonadota bacterium]
MIGLTMKHLRYLDALAREAHFGRAAAACFISQPALSQQIKELEAMVGTPLIERTTRRVALTPFGARFLTRARDILVAVDDLGDLARSARDALSGELRFGIIPTMAPYVLPRIVTALAKDFPDIDLRPREAVTGDLIADLRASRIDVAMLALPIGEDSLTEVPLFDEDFVLIRARADAALPVPAPSELKTMRLLLLEQGHCFRDQAISFCGIGDTRAQEVMEASSLSTLVQMVDAGIGVTVIPEMALDFETRSAEVSVARFPDPAPKRTVGLAWRKSSALSDEFAQIAQLVKTACRPA